MAESPSEEIRGLTCSICYQNFKQTGPMTPRNLTCGHCYCTGCLSMMVGQVHTDLLRCPTCKSDTYIPGLSAAITKLPKNFGVLEVLSVNEETKIKTNTSTTAPLGGVSKKDIIRRASASVGVVSSTSSSNEVLRCEAHENEVKKVYCKTDKQLICIYCQVYGSHKSHDCQLVSTVAEESRQGLILIAESIASEKAILHSTMTELDTQVSAIRQREATLIQDISQYFETLHRKLIRREDSLKEILNMKTALKIDLLEHQIRDVSKRVDKADLLDSYTQAVLTSSDIHVLDHTELIEYDLERLMTMLAEQSASPGVRNDLHVSLPKDFFPFLPSINSIREGLKPTVVVSNGEVLMPRSAASRSCSSSSDDCEMGELIPPSSLYCVPQSLLGELTTQQPAANSHTHTTVSPDIEHWNSLIENHPMYVDLTNDSESESLQLCVAETEDDYITRLYTEAMNSDLDDLLTLTSPPPSRNTITPPVPRAMSTDVAGDGTTVESLEGATGVPAEMTPVTDMATTVARQPAIPDSIVNVVRRIINRPPLTSSSNLTADSSNAPATTAGPTNTPDTAAGPSDSPSFSAGPNNCHSFIAGLNNYPTVNVAAGPTTTTSPSSSESKATTVRETVRRCWEAKSLPILRSSSVSESASDDEMLHRNSAVGQTTKVRHWSSSDSTQLDRPKLAIDVSTTGRGEVVEGVTGRRGDGHRRGVELNRSLEQTMRKLNKKCRKYETMLKSALTEHRDGPPSEVQGELEGATGPDVSPIEPPNGQASGEPNTADVWKVNTDLMRMYREVITHRRRNHSGSVRQKTKTDVVQPLTQLDDPVFPLPATKRRDSDRCSLQLCGSGKRSVVRCRLCNKQFCSACLCEQKPQVTRCFKRTRGHSFINVMKDQPPAAASIEDPVTKSPSTCIHCLTTVPEWLDHCPTCARPHRFNMQSEQKCVMCHSINSKDHIKCQYCNTLLV